MEKGLVSVIIPVYNVECYLYECLNTVANQTYKNIEVIIIDDGSTDSSGGICDYFSQNDTRFIVIHQSNAGVSAARNVGLGMAQGEFILFVDGDDCIVNNMISNMVDLIEENNADCVNCGCYQVKDVKSVPNDIQSDVFQKIFNREYMIRALQYMHHPYSHIEMTAVWGTLFRTYSLKNVFFNETMCIGEDFCFKYQAYKNMNRFICTSFVGYIYRISENSTMRNGFNKKKINSIEVLENLIKEDYNTKYIDGLICRAVNIAFVILIDIPNTETAYKRKVIQFIKKYRSKVLKNKKARNKVKLAIVISYINFGLVSLIMKLKKGFESW